MCLFEKTRCFVFKNTFDNRVEELMYDACHLLTNTEYLQG